MNKQTLFVSLTAAVMLCACQSSKVKISGRIVGNDAKNVYLEQVSPLSQSVIDSAVLDKEGNYRFELKGVTRTPSLYNIIYNGERIPLFLAGGDRLSVNSVGSFIRNYTVEGSKETELLRQFYQAFVTGAQQLENMGIVTHTVSMDNYFNTIDPETAPRNREGAIDYESPFCLDIELLNRVQLGKPLSDEEIARLRSKRLIEGRKPKIYIAKHIAQKVGQKIEYSEHKGLGNKRCEEFLLTALRDHKSLSRREIDKLLWNLLSNLLDDRQKKDKITNLLAKLKRQGKIRNESQGPNSDWFIV